MSKLTGLRRFFIGETQEERSARRCTPIPSTATHQPRGKSGTPLWLKIVLFVGGWILAVRLIHWVIGWVRDLVT